MNLPPKISSEVLYTYQDVLNRTSHFSNFDQEAKLLITLSSDFRIIQEHLVTLGTYEETNSALNIILNRIIVDKATKFITIHNHPNGRAAFSREDYLSVVKLRVLAKMLDIDYVDEILLTYLKEPVSMKARHPKFWSIEFLDKLDEMLVKDISKLVGRKI